MASFRELALLASTLASIAHGAYIPQVQACVASDANGIQASPTLKELVNQVIVPTASIPSPTPSTFIFPTAEQWQAGNGTLWAVEYVGPLNFTNEMQTKHLGGDKCRTGSINGTVLWTCGDMECNQNPYDCGFSMGPGFYGTPDVGTIDTTAVSNVGDYTFATAWAGDPQPVAPYDQYGMDTSNVVALNATHGVAYVWEIWRGAPNASIVNQGPGAVSVTLGPDRPLASRVGPLLAGPDALQLGLLAILRDAEYVYVYSYGGPTNVNVARVGANDSVFDASAYEFLVHGGQWESPGAVPDGKQTRYGLSTLDPSGAFGCMVYGSVFYNAAWGLYVILCNAYMSVTMMYVSPSPAGPFSPTLNVLDYPGYGSMAHPEFGVNPLYFSQGPDGPFQMFKLSFNF